MKAKEIINVMNNWAKPFLIDYWDNTGFQIGNENKKVEKILISLDLDAQVLEKAIDEDYQMIITHHPLIFKPIKSITNASYKEKLIYSLIQNDIVVYNAHTNLDQTENGVNDELAKSLGLQDTRVLVPNDLDETNIYGYGKIGSIDDIDLLDYIKIIKKKLKCEHVTVYGDVDRKINKVAVSGGSGAGFIYNAYEAGACVYITGDIKYHDAQLGDELGLTIIDAGHYHTEKIILPIIKKYLKEENSKLHIEIWDKPSPTYRIY